MTRSTTRSLSYVCYTLFQMIGWWHQSKKNICFFGS